MLFLQTNIPLSLTCVFKPFIFINIIYMVKLKCVIFLTVVKLSIFSFCLYLLFCLFYKFKIFQLFYLLLTYYLFIFKKLNSGFQKNDNIYLWLSKVYLHIIISHFILCIVFTITYFCSFTHPLCHFCYIFYFNIMNTNEWLIFSFTR